MAPQTTLAPYLDAGTTYGQDYRYPQSISVPYLDGGVGFAPYVTGTSLTGLTVDVGGTVLTGAFARGWRDEQVGPGTWNFTLANDDANMPDFGELVTFKESGKIRFAGPVVRKNAKTYGPNEGADKVTMLSGKGRLAVTDKSVIAPSRGWDAVPVEVTRSLSWVSVDFDDGSWKRVKRIRRVDDPTPYSPFRTSPEWYPDRTAYKVAPNRADITGLHAPVGASLYRSDPITLDEGTIEIIHGLNNQGRIYFDGALIADVQNNPPTAGRVRLDVSAGDHVIAAAVTNFIRDTWFVGSIYTVDDEGLLEPAVVWSSDSDNMRALPYPSAIPGFTPGEAIRLLVEEIQADGELTDLELDFSDTVDSDGAVWSTVLEITTDVGRSLLDFLTSLTDWMADVQMAPGANLLRAWNWGTRGHVSGATIVATTNPLTSETEGLGFDGEHIRANRLRIRYKRGFTYVDESGSDPTVTAFLDLSEIDGESTAQEIGTNLLALRKDPSWAGTLALLPASSDPYDDFDNGDYVTHPPNPNGDTSSRVRAMTRGEDPDGNEQWEIELHDIREQPGELQNNWLRRAAMGSLAGGAKVTSRTGDSIAPAQTLSARDVAEFSFQDPVDGAITAKRQASSSGNLIEINVEVSTEDDIATSSSTEVEVWKNGALLDTVTVPTGETSAEADLTATKTYRNIDTYRAVAVTVGGNVNGISVQVRAI